MKYVKPGTPLEKVFFRQGRVTDFCSCKIGIPYILYINSVLDKPVWNRFGLARRVNRKDVIHQSSFTESKLRFCARRFLALTKKSNFLKAPYFLLFSLFIFIFISGCANNSGPDLNFTKVADVPLVTTEQYLPVQERDETGALLPYIAEENPYTQLRGRISKTAVTQYIEARRAFNAKNFNDAEKLLGQLVNEEPELGGPWVMRGDIASLNDDLDQAAEHYSKAIQVSPLNFNAYLRLAKTQRQQGRFNHAQNTYALALNEWRDGPELHLNLGILYDVYLNQPLQAQAHMEAYQLLSPDHNENAITWLKEVRQRTGVASTLKVIGENGELELISDAKINTESSISGSNSAREQKLSITDSGLE